MSDPRLHVPPTLVQGSDAPLFKMGGDEDLRCPRCAFVLVAGYRPRSLVAIGICCFGCQHEFVTEPWPDDEPLPIPVVTLGKSGRFLIAETVDVIAKPIVITCDQEIARVAALTGVRKAPSNPFDLSEAGLQELTAEFDALTNGTFSKALASAERAKSRGNARFMESVPAWAISHLTQCLRDGAIDVRTADGVALHFLTVARQLFSRWQHHPLFPEIARSLVSEFHHTVGLLVSASYLADVGNKVGFTDVRKEKGRSPDLYLNAAPYLKASIEVKAPKALQWPGVIAPMSGQVEAIVEKALREARKQIPEAGGLVVVASSSFDPDMRNHLESAVRLLVTRGQISSRIAGVSTLSPSLQQTGIVIESSAMSLHGAFSVSIVKNPRYCGPLNIRTGESDSP